MISIPLTLYPCTYGEQKISVIFHKDEDGKITISIPKITFIHLYPSKDQVLLWYSSQPIPSVVKPSTQLDFIKNGKRFKIDTDGFIMLESLNNSIKTDITL